MYQYLILLFLFIIFLFFSINYKNKYNKGSNRHKHQLFTADDSVPLVGGYFIMVVFLFNTQITLIQNLFFLIIFIIGILSDIKLINSPKIRFFAQLLTVWIFIYYSKIYLSNTGFDFLDTLLNYKIFNILFTVYCIIILINGSNFIDGVNGLTSGYYLLVLVLISYLGINESDIINANFCYFLIFALLAICLLNLFNKIYLGDGGSYLLGFFIGSILISIYIENSDISSFFIILLLWYPCFENLFSIIRKNWQKKSPMKPDNNHFHQLMYNYIKRTFKLESKLLPNNITSILIISYNLVIFYIASLNITGSKYQISIIIFNIIVYLFLYKKFKKMKI
jgi:UDP-N-acetylmuramyl pentapeptide phosphotransferase/UDP-N-acetylglucosamine-1-phosphate transferase